MRNIFLNIVRERKWLHYIMAALMVFVLAMTGCGAAQESADEKAGASEAAGINPGDTGDSWDETDGPQDAYNGSKEESDADKGIDAASDAVSEEYTDGAPADGASGTDGSDEPAEDGTYTTKDDVARYLYIYGHLPSNFITKKEANELGWEGGSLEPYAPGKCIGGSRFGNYEGLLPEKEGRVYTECDIDTLGADRRGAKRIVFSNDGLIYYTGDHYESFELLYGDD